MDWENFEYIVKVNGTNTVRQNVLMPGQEDEWEHELRSVGFQDVSNSVTTGRLYVTDGVVESFYRSWSTLSAATIYYDNNLRIPIGPTKRFGMALYGITSGDALEVYFVGKRRRVE